MAEGRYPKRSRLQKADSRMQNRGGAGSRKQQKEEADSKKKEIEEAMKMIRENPMMCCDKAACEDYIVTAKGFFSTYKEKMQEAVLNGARSMVFEVSECKDISLEASEPPVKNEANLEAEEWHHKYDVKFKVASLGDPKDFLAAYFGETVKQMGDSAVKISYVETNKQVA